MKRVLLDANFILIPGQFGVDIFSELERLIDEGYELCTLDMVVDELKALTEKGSGKDKAAARLGLGLIKAKNVVVLKTEKHLSTDKVIVETAKSPDFIVATQDKELKRFLKENNTKTVVLRQKKHLEFD